ncbi:MAG TPA: hypothetical protein VLL76_10575 [Candidatus Omnitrophota bacterium]|nr:hypothetical protein [Candidatus Omnitrophota bacterium]
MIDNRHPLYLLALSQLSVPEPPRREPRCEPAPAKVPEVPRAPSCAPQPAGGQ